MACRREGRNWIRAAAEPKEKVAKIKKMRPERTKYTFNPKTEVDRGDLMQSAGREGHSSEITVSLDTLISSS